MQQIPGVPLTAHTAAAQDVGPVRVDVIHDEAGVGDDQAGMLPGLGAALLLEQLGDDRPHHLEVLQVDARFRFVQEHHLGILGQQLQEFGTLELTPGKAVIDLPVQKLAEIVGRGQDFGHDGASGAHPQDIRSLDPPDGGRALEGKAQAQAGPLIDGHVGDILAQEADAPLLHLITLETHDAHEQAGLAGAVLAEEDMGLPDGDPQVDPLEHFLVVDVYPEVVDLKHKNLDCNEKAPKADFGGHRQTELG